MATLLRRCLTLLAQGDIINHKRNKRVGLSSSTLRVASPPPKPLMIFDGDCQFCRTWISRWQQLTGNQVDYVPFQDPIITEKFGEIPRERFEASVQLIDLDGTVYDGAEAVF